MENSNFLIILVGLPASGKSTLAESIKKQILIKFKLSEDRLSIIDPDLIRDLITENSLEFDPNIEPTIRKENLEKVRKELGLKKIVISDDLNYYRSMRHDLKLIADDLHIPYFIVQLNTPLKTCLEWNKERGSIIPNEVIYKIKEKMDTFDRYNWDFPIYSVDLSVSKDLDEVSNEILNIIEINLNLMKENSKMLKLDKDDEYLNKKKKDLDLLTRKSISRIIKSQKISLNGRKISNFRRQFINEYASSPLNINELIDQFEKLLRKKLENLRK